MKTVKMWGFAMLVALFATAGYAQKTAAEDLYAAQIDSASYITGLAFGKQLKESDRDMLSMEIIIQGIRDGLAGKEPRYQIDSAELEALVKEVKLKSNELAGAKFLENNKKNVGVVALPSGLQYKIAIQGAGIMPAAEDTVEVHYKGMLIDGREFDSSYGRGKPSKFALNKVIKGWTEGLQQVREGSKVTFYIPSHLAYGARQRGVFIKPGSTLIFEIELLEVTKAAATP